MVKNTFITDSIGETLLITLYMKYLESKKPAPIITDKTACDIINKIDYDFTKYDKDITTSVGVAIRANYFDEIAKNFISKNQNPVIVVIGCGLDSRYERVGELSKKAIFYQLDIPEVMQVRKKLIPLHRNETCFSASMFETEWMNTLSKADANGKILFIIEGVLMYFSKENVRSLFQNLSKRFPGSEILFDILSIWMSKNSHLQKSVKHTRAKFIYGTNNDREMESWADNLEFISCKLYTDFKESRRVGLIYNCMMKLIPKLKKAGRMLHYRIK